MGRPDRYFGFFRGRVAALNRGSTPLYSRFNTEIFREHDNRKALLEVTLAYSQRFPGAFSFQDLWNMDIEEHRYLIKRYEELKPKDG